MPPFKNILFLIASFISFSFSLRDDDLNELAGKSRDVRSLRQDLENRHGVVALLAPELLRATYVAYDAAERTEKDFSGREASERSKRAPGQGRRRAGSDRMSGEMESSEENGPSGGQRRGWSRSSNNGESGANSGGGNNMETNSRGRGNRGRGKGKRGMNENDEKPQRNMENGNDMDSSSRGRDSRRRGKERGGMDVESERNMEDGNDMENSSRGRGNRGRGGRERGGMKAESVRNSNDKRRGGQGRRPGNDREMDGEVPKMETDGLVFNSNMDLGA